MRLISRAVMEKLKDSKVYKLRERLDNGDKLSRAEKNWLTRNVKECCHFKRGNDGRKHVPVYVTEDMEKTKRNQA